MKNYQKIKTAFNLLTSYGMTHFKILFIAILNIFSVPAFSQATLNISTPAGWVPTGTPIANISTSTFYGHTNWVQINSPLSNTTYKFKREFYVCKDGMYNIKLKGYGDNRLVVKVDNGAPVMDHHITVAAGFNTPITKESSVFLKCGKHGINVEVTNDYSIAGFYLDAEITSNEGTFDDKPCCLVKVKVCNCPKDWYSNNDKNVLGGNQLGGEVDEAGPRKCKKLICKPIGISPLPPNGTQLTNNIGFTWGDELWFYGTIENGGWPVCTEKWIRPSTPSLPVRDIEIRKRKER